jgi:hypothetical protein
MPTAASSEAVLVGTGGPDTYGYTWNDAVPIAWVDASGGANRTSDPINLGFSFKFYENVYSQIYVSQYGYACFSNDVDTSPSQIPSPRSANNVIAPYWGPLCSVNGYIRYLTGGAAPNRFFVVEWNRTRDSCGSSEYTFEMILHENGDIVFQYQTMNYSGGYCCQASGIEDARGMDGLAITYFCDRIAPNHAVRISPPAPGARVGIYTPYQGSFATPGAAVTFQIAVRNTGDLGADTYDLTTSSAWPLSLCAADGTTPLTDTDGDGTIDSDAVSPGNTAGTVARVEAPAVASVGDANAATITARSSLDTSKSKTVTLQMAIPAPFAQVYVDRYDGAPSLYLAQPAAQKVKKADNRSTSGWKYEPVVAEAPNGNFVCAWREDRQLHNNVYVVEIAYALLDKYGDIVRSVTKLATHSGAAEPIYDYSAAVAAAPDGRIGVVWIRELVHVVDNNWLENYNVFFAILDAAGNAAYGPLNLTNNSGWGTWGTPDVPQFHSPRITATEDNRFVLAWHREQPVSDCPSNDCTTNDIYYAVRDTRGNEVRGITQFTHDTPGDSGERYSSSTLSALRGNRALLTWARSSDSDIYYAVLDSAGSVVKDQTNLVGDGGGRWDWGLDAVQLADGAIVVAWTGSSPIRFAVLDTQYNRRAGPTTLSNPSATTVDAAVSVAADNAGHAILTWMDPDGDARRCLYYALVNGSGSILTPPMIFRSGQGDAPHIDSSSTGYGNTSYGSSIATGVDAAIGPGGSLAGGAPGGAAVIGVTYTNHGLTSATGLVVTATLGSELTYLCDTSAVSPTMTGNSITWSLPDIGFLDERQFGLYLGVPGTAAIGTRYPVTLTLSANEPDANVVDNTATLEVMAALQVYLPVVTR